MNSDKFLDENESRLPTDILLLRSELSKPFARVATFTIALLLDPHYADRVDAYPAGRYLKVPFKWEDVEAKVETRTVLIPHD